MLAILLIILAILFAVNMGGSGIAPTFSAEYGAGVISKKRASLLFAFFVLLGAYLLGFNVVKVIRGGIISEELLDVQGAIIIFLSTTISLFLANLYKIPASTSQITVFSIAGYGAYYNAVKWGIFKRLIPLWFVLPLAAFILTYFAGKYLYPRIKHWNHKSIKFWNLATSCYTAFSIGSNNVANASGVLVGAGVMSAKPATFMLAPFFGIGGFLLGKGNLESIGKNVTKLNMISAGIISLITGTLLVSASLIGLPQSLVQLNSFAIFGLGVARKGEGMRILARKIIKKSFITWTMSPALGFTIAYFMTKLIK
jgi:sulfate permease